MSEQPSAPATAAILSGPARKLRFHVLRHDPRDPQSVPHTEVFELEEAAGMTLFLALTEIRENLAAMRAENREAMDATLIQSRPLSQSPEQGMFSRFFGALGRGIADVVTLRAFGL